LLCIEEGRYQYLEKLINSNKRIYRKTDKRIPGTIVKETPDVHTSDELRVIMTDWYHGKFASIKTRNCTEEQLWGDLTVEQKIRLKRILKGEL